MKGPPQYSRVLQEAGASLSAPEGARRRRRRRMFRSLGSLSPRQSYLGYAVSRDFPRLPSVPLDYPSQQRRLFPMATAVCLPAFLLACLSRTPRRMAAATRIEISHARPGYNPQGAPLFAPYRLMIRGPLPTSTRIDAPRGTQLDTTGRIYR